MAKSLDQKVNGAGIHTAAAAAETERSARHRNDCSWKDTCSHTHRQTHKLIHIYQCQRRMYCANWTLQNTCMCMQGVSVCVSSTFWYHFFPSSVWDSHIWAQPLHFVSVWIQQKKTKKKKGVRVWEVPLGALPEWASVYVYRLLNVCLLARVEIENRLQHHTYLTQCRLKFSGWYFRCANNFDTTSTRLTFACWNIKWHKNAVNSFYFSLACSCSNNQIFASVCKVFFFSEQSWKWWRERGKNVNIWVITVLLLVNVYSVLHATLSHSTQLCWSLVWENMWEVASRDGGWVFEKYH